MIEYIYYGIIIEEFNVGRMRIFESNLSELFYEGNRSNIKIQSQFEGLHYE